MIRIILVEPEADRPILHALFNNHPRPFDWAYPDDITGFELRHL